MRHVLSGLLALAAASCATASGIGDFNPDANDGSTSMVRQDTGPGLTSDARGSQDTGIDATQPPDAGADATVPTDGGADATQEASSDAGADSTTDAPGDTAPGEAGEASVDAGHDSGKDTGPEAAADCVIGGVAFASGVVNPGDACQSCEPASSASAWTNASDGTSCGNGQICVAGACGSECDIAGSVFTSGQVNPGDACQTCQPGKSTTSWTSVADGSACNGGNQVCVGGVCSGVCGPGQTSCSGSQVQGCSPTGTWVTTQTCAQPAPDCQNGACTCLETLCGGTTCTTLDTVNNCGGCGDQCNLTGASNATCNGSACSYTCSTGHSDCDKGTGPDTNGCECATPSCCATGCQTTHSDGLGQSFYDCKPIGTHTDAAAMQACTAYAASIGGSAANCSDEWGCNANPALLNVCYGNTAGTTCTEFCWSYAGTPGEVTSCSDCTTAAGTWN